MSIYILSDKTYEIFPNIKKEKSNLSPKQLKKIAEMLSENFGCFILFSMSLQGEPQVLLSGSSGMEHLALKKFAEDVVLGETNIAFSPLEESDDDEN